MSDRNGAAGVTQRGGRVAPLLLSAVCAGYAVGSVLGWGSRQLSLVMGDFTLGAAAATAAAACLRQGRSHDGRSRPAWLLFALSFTMAALGHLVSGWYATAPGAGTAGPMPAGPLFLCFAPPAAAGLLLLAKPPLSRTGWVRLALDAWLVGGALFTLYRSLSPADAVQHTVLTPARPLLDIALVSMALVLHFRRSGAGRHPAVGTAAAALASVAAGDLLITTPLRDAAWFGGSLLISYTLRGSRRMDAAEGPRPLHGVRTDSPPAGAPLSALAPYLAAAVCALGILYDFVVGRRMDGVALFTVCTVVLGLVVRQGIMLLDNIALTQELVKNQNHFRDLIQSSSDVIMVAAPNGVLQYVSPASSGVYGREAEELVGQELTALVHPQDLGRLVYEVRRFFGASAVEEPTTRVEYRFRSGDGSWLEVESTVSRHRGGLLFNSRDVTPRVRFPGRIGRQADPDLPPPAPGFAASEPQGGEADTTRPLGDDAPQEDMVPTGHVKRTNGPAEPGGRVLQLGALLLPAEERAEWLQEQAACMAGLPTRGERWRWIIDQLFAMPRYAYTVRSGREKESA